MCVCVCVVFCGMRRENKRDIQREVLRLTAVVSAYVFIQLETSAV